MRAALVQPPAARRDVIITRVEERDEPFEAWNDPDRLNQNTFRRD
jgi:hypothetical protein